MRVALIVGVALAVVALLSARFPYAWARPDMLAQAAYLLLVLALVARSGLIRRLRATQAVRDALLWTAIALLLVLGYSFRGALEGSRLAAALLPSRVQAASDGGLSIEMAQDGHFHIEAEVNGTPLDFLIDTGASDIVLSPRDAESAGYEPETLNYTRTYQTASGIGRGAPVRIETLAVGPYTLHDVPAAVNSAETGVSLLGMTFLKRFRQYRVSGDTLTLYP